MEAAVADELAGRLEEAERRYERLVAEDDGNGELWLRLAAVREEREDWRGAIEAAERAAAAHEEPEARAGVRNLAGMCWLHLNEPKAAERELRRSLAERPDPGTCVFLNTSLVMQGRDEEARQCLEEALRLDPDYEEAHYNLGCNDRRRGDSAAAEKRFRRAIEIDPDYALAHAELGHVLLGRDPEEALRVLQRAIELDASHVWSRIYLAWLHWSCKRLDEAEHEYQAAIALAPSWGDPHWTYADFLACTRDAREPATTHFERALALDPDDHTAPYHYAKALLRWGVDEERAVALLRAAADAGNDRAAKLLANIDEPANSGVRAVGARAR